MRFDTNTPDVSCDENKLTDTQIINNSISNIPVVCTDHNIHNTPANQFKYVWLEKFDTFYHDCIDLKKYIIIFYFIIWYSKKFGFQ